jgi:acetyl-CoA carboxylase biotin carboxylase subunit
VFVANRGEIALRIIRACQALEIETVLGASAADTDSAPAKLADRTVCIGPAPAARSYLLPETAVHAALATGCDALHPGYGFLSENASLAHMCGENGIVFIGPSTEHLLTFGDKLSARRAAEAVGVSLLPGAAVDDVAEAESVAREIGFPVLLKAAHGGGGKGIRIVRDPDRLAAEFSMAAAEAVASFGHGGLYVERYVERAKHVEVQLVGDRHGNVIHLGERECSVQHGYQKLVEESPCPALSPERRAALCAEAVRLGADVGYDSLGTVEFLVDAETSAFYFLEVNPRIQVEHPVTEAVTGIDLVREQIAIAAGRELSIRQRDVRPSGHAIECRLNARQAGTIERWQVPGGDGVRVDTHCHDGYVVPPYYDALLGKLIVWSATRDAALDGMRRVLLDSSIEGIETNLPLQRTIVEHPDFAAGRVTTHWLEDLLTGAVA